MFSSMKMKEKVSSTTFPLRRLSCAGGQKINDDRMLEHHQNETHKRTNTNKVLGQYLCLLFRVMNKDGLEMRRQRQNSGITIIPKTP